MRLKEIQRRRGIASKGIFSGGEQSEMVRVPAQFITANMVNGKIVWNRPLKQRIGNAMDVGCFPSKYFTTQPTVAITSHGPSPFPTSRFCYNPSLKQFRFSPFSARAFAFKVSLFALTFWTHKLARLPTRRTLHVKSRKTIAGWFCIYCNLHLLRKTSPPKKVTSAHDKAAIFKRLENIVCIMFRHVKACSIFSLDRIHVKLT